MKVGRTVEAEQQLRHTLTIARSAHGDLDSITATTLNNLGDPPLTNPIVCTLH